MSTAAAATEFTDGELAFQRDFRAWLDANADPEWRRDRPMLRLAGGPEMHDLRKTWHRRMHAGGWVAVDWPREFGGRGVSLREKVIYNQELARYKCPEIYGWMGVEFVGRTLMDYGTPQQQQEFLPRILAGEMTWSMGYSEPDAGTDLANLKTAAALDGDDFVVNGAKLWNHSSPDGWMFTLVRTDPAAPRHKGISYLLIDLSLPGVTVKDFASMVSPNGFTEVTFENVRVPRRYLVGDLHDGWRVGMATLAYDRATTGATIGIVNMMGHFERAARRDLPGRLGQTANRARWAGRQIEAAVSKALDDRNLAIVLAGGTPGAEGSQSKLFYSELEQRMAESMMQVMGMHGLLAKDSPHAIDDGLWSLEYLWSKALSVAGGTSETLRTTLGTRKAGLPRG